MSLTGHQKKWGRIQEAFQRSLSGEFVTYELVFNRKDGTRFDVMVSPSCIKDEKGNIVSFHATFKDISPLKKAMRELEKSEQHKAVLMDNLPALIASIGIDEQLELVNTTFASFFEIDPMQQGIYIIDVLSPKGYAKVKRHIDTALAGKRTDFQTAIESPKGLRKMAVSHIPKVNDEGEPDGFYALITDITDFKNAQAKLESLNTDLELKVKERTQKLLEANKELYEANQYLKAQKLDLNNTLNRLRSTENHLVNSEKLASLGMLTAEIAHEINNPLNYAANSVASMKKTATALSEIFHEMLHSLPHDEQEKLFISIEKAHGLNPEELLNLIQASIDEANIGTSKINEIVRGINYIANGNSKMVHTDLHDAIEASLTVMHRLWKNRVTINKKFTKLPLVECHGGKINQVLVNLIANALQAIEGKGVLNIATSSMQEEAAADGKKYVIIEIEDSGRGIPEENTLQVFDAFYSTKASGKGTGLGLYICKKIIEEHGGSIQVQSRINVGSTFSVTLPVEQEKEATNT